MYRVLLRYIHHTPFHALTHSIASSIPNPSHNFITSSPCPLEEEVGLAAGRFSRISSHRVQMVVGMDPGVSILSAVFLFL